MAIINDNLRTIRGLMGLTQTQFSDILNTPRTTYTHYENGNSEPGIAFAVTVSKLTSLNVDTLISEDLSAKNPEKLASELLKSVSIQYLQLYAEVQGQKSE